MRIKVCGMRLPDNMKALCTLPIDYMGLIFHKSSPRYVCGLSCSDVDRVMPQSIERVGVFVNESLTVVLNLIEEYGLNAVQLHGNESVSYCVELREKCRDGVKLIKAFNVSSVLDFESTTDYEGYCNYFLFDTKTKDYGGSGQKFDWAILSEYKGSTPFFLSGGINVSDIVSVRSVNHPLLYGVDINSRFEIEPGLKNIELVEQFVKNLDNE